MGRYLGLAVVCLWCALPAVTSETDNRAIGQPSGQPDPAKEKGGGCLMPEEFTQCWVSEKSGNMVGENSYCNVTSGSVPGIVRCQEGTWIPAVKKGGKPLSREKKGWFRRRRRRRRTPPPPPNQKPYFTSCPSDITVTAPPNQKDAVVRFFVHAADKEGTPSLNLNQGQKSGTRFNEGSTVVRYTAVDGGGLSATCVFRVKVQVVRCPHVPQHSAFPHGSQSCTGIEKNIYGSLCHHSCLQGYQISGSEQVTCLSSGTWSARFPSCKYVSCGDPGNVYGGQVICPKGHNYPHTCFVRCHSGMENMGVVYTTCENNGQWSSRLSHCSPRKEGKPLSREKKGWFWRRRRRRSPPPPPPPPPPNQAPYFTSCPSDITLTAPPNQKSAVVRFNVQAADKEGSVSVSLSQGAASGSRFNEGDTVVMYTATDSPGLTATCVFRVRVTVVKCPRVAHLASFPHGSQQCSGIEQNIYGSVCRHTCDKGYVLKGQATITCQKSRSWSSSFPSCQPVTCGDPGKVTGGHVSCPQGQGFPARCTIRCNAGYKISVSGLSDVTCQSNGQWSSKLPSCKDTEPPQFPNGCPPSQTHNSGPLGAAVDVTWVDPVTTDNSRDGVTLTSDLEKGSKLGLGQHKVTLTAKDKVGNEQKCHFRITIKAKQCPALLDLTNGQYSCTHNNTEGSTCTATCQAGYVLKGTSTLRCLASEQWHQSAPTCQVVVCPLHPPVPQGSVQCPPGGVKQQGAGMTCRVTCQAGFRLQGPANVTCQHDATWTLAGTCEDVQSPQFPKGCPADQHVYAAAFGQDTKVTWSPPNVTDNSRHTVNLHSDVTPGASFSPGITKVTYNATDQDGNFATCDFIVNVTALQCPKPSEDLATDDDTMTANVYSCPEGHVQGARCTVNCTQGYALVGEDSIACSKVNGTYPPTAHWTWQGGRDQSMKPVCREERCPTPPAPKNGALTCFLGSLGPVCQLSCHKSWDLPYPVSEHLYCINQRGQWSSAIDAVETGCVKPRLPHDEYRPNVHYFAGSCKSSSESLRQSFIPRFKDSVLKDACVGVPSCTPRNIKVYCGPESSTERIHRREAEDTDAPAGKDGGREYLHPHPHHLHPNLRPHPNPSHHHGPLHHPHHSYGPKGTGENFVSDWRTLWEQKHPRHRMGKMHSGVANGKKGCPPGHFLSTSAPRHCLECPRGQFSEGGKVPACTACPKGTSTFSTGATHVSRCLPP